MTWRRALAVASLLWFAAPAGASPLPAADAVIAVDDCPQLDRAVLERAAFVDRAVAHREPRAIAIAVVCDAALATITVSAAGLALTRTVDVSAYPADSHARIVALAIAELVVEVLAQPAEDRAGPALAPPRRHRAPIASVERTSAMPAPAGQRRDVGLVGRFSMIGGERLQGIGAVYSGRFEPLSVAVDGHYDAGQHGSALGTIAIHAAGAGVQAGFDHRIGAIALAAGAGARVSVVRLSGVAQMHGISTRDMTAPIGGPFVAAGATIQGSEHAFLRAGLEAGYLAMRLSARVDDVSRSAIELRGAWLTATLSAGLGW